MIAILNRGHGQKSAERFDPGAVHGTIREVDLVAAYFAVVEQRLQAAGVQVHNNSSGPYAVRHNRAHQIARNNPGQLVIHLFGHVNSAERPGNYALFVHDHRSRSGERAALAMVDPFREIPELARIQVVAADRTGSWRRAYSVVRPTYAGPGNICGLLLEPGFIQRPEHQPLWTADGAERVGEAIAAGVLAYFGGWHV